jgi:intermediate cleaving peptidase 55
MVVTIEPGIYIPYDSQFPKEYQGIGIRIEDDVLVTDLDEPIVLSAEAPKEIVDIEYVCSQDTDLHLNL